ncbi:serine hydrolase domain-containing protein, partial [Enterococcus silesiacus]
KIVTVIGMLVLFLQTGLLTQAQEVQKGTENDLSIEKQVDQIMDKYIGKEIPGASIGIVKDGKVILTKGYGVSDIEKKTPVTGDKTVFEMGSVTKLFTWSMLMKLAEEGKVELDADIQNYLPEGTLNLAFDKKITILDLMHHTAGFEEKLEGMSLENRDQLKPLKETITKKSQPKQVYEPGTVTAYSNYGAALAGYIIEQVTGQDYLVYMNQAIQEQLQMNQSTFSMVYDDHPSIKDHKSLGYNFEASKFEKVNENYSLMNDFPAGSLHSTATDMTHFLLMLLDDAGNTPYKFFAQSETLKQLKTQSYSMIPETEGNAHGFWEKEVNGKHTLEHGGNLVGFSAQLSLVPKEGLGYVLLTNITGEATGIRDELETLLYGYTPTAGVPLEQSPTDQKVTGQYRTSRNIYSTMAKLYYIINADKVDITITENKEGGINVKGPGGKEATTYVEVKPGVYQKVQKEENDTSRQYIYVVFNEKGEVLRINFGPTDFLPVTSILETQLFNFIAFGV